jgi:hypothetical protein
MNNSAFSKKVAEVYPDKLKIVTDNNPSALKMLSLAHSDDDVHLEEMYREDLYTKSDGETELTFSFDTREALHRWRFMWDAKMRPCRHND